MQDARTTARNRLECFTAAWLTGDEDAITRTCSPGVRWWTPLGGETDPGPTATWASLAAVLDGTPRPIEVTALAISEDGSRGVLELRGAPTAPTGSASLVTSVVTVSAGKIVEGRTYADPEVPAAPVARDA